jgi:hypothetical protein
MTFSDMVAAAAEAERRRRQKARDALVEAADRTESPWTELAERITQDSSRSATMIHEAWALAPMTRAKAELSQVINNATEAQQQDQSTQTTGQVDSIPRKAKDNITAKKKGNVRRLLKSVKPSMPDGDGGPKTDVPKVPAQNGNILPKSQMDIDARQEGEAPPEDKLAKGNGQDDAGRQTVELKAVVLTVPSRPINQDSGAQQGDPSIKTSKQVRYALQKPDMSTAGKKDSLPGNAAEPIIEDAEQGIAVPQAQGNTQRPAPLTASSLNRLIPKKRKRSSKSNRI